MQAAPEKESLYKRLDKKFEIIANFTSKIVGSPAWFIFSVAVIVLWIPSRFLFENEELWHLFINTFTTILTFLMMALLHSSQSRWEEKIEALEKKQSQSINKVNKETKKINKEIKKTNTVNALGSTSQEISNNIQLEGNDFDDNSKKSVQITSLL